MLSASQQLEALREELYEVPLQQLTGAKAAEISELQVEVRFVDVCFPLHPEYVDASSIEGSIWIDLRCIMTDLVRACLRTRSGSVFVLIASDVLRCFVLLTTVKAYLERHRVDALMEDMLASVIQHMPSYPEPFLINLLKRKTGSTIPDANNVAPKVRNARTCVWASTL